MKSPCCNTSIPVSAYLTANVVQDITWVQGATFQLLCIVVEIRIAVKFIL